MVLGTPQCPLSEELKFYGKMEFLKNVQVNTKFFRRYGAEIQNFCRLLEGHISDKILHELISILFVLRAIGNS